MDPLIKSNISLTSLGIVYELSWSYNYTMKKILKIFILFCLISTGTLISTQDVSAQNQRVSFQVFYDDLSPHGTWFQSPDYGYVWRPNMSSSFTPYSTGGYWVLTDFGWTWVSDYSWGWAPFHYGRWYYDSFYGYVWVPDYEWSPGWVSWRRSNDYYGWAPLGPGMGYNDYNISYNNWRFVNCRNFGRRNIQNYYINTTNNTTIINNTTVINNTRKDQIRNTTYNAGPDRLDVQKKTGKPVKEIAIIDENKPVQRVSNAGMRIYRPLVDKDDNAAVKPAPSKVLPFKEGKPVVKQPTPGREEPLNQPIKQAPVKQQTIPDDAIKQVPVKEPVKAEIKTDRPVREQKINQPVKEKPVVREQKIQPQTQKETPVQQPDRPERVREQNTNPPVQQQPVRPERVREQNTNPPVQQQPVRPERVREQNTNPPVQQQPVRPERVREQNTNPPAQQPRVQQQQQTVRPQNTNPPPVRQQTTPQGKRKD